MKQDRKQKLMKILDPTSVEDVEEELKNPNSLLSITLRNNQINNIAAEVFYKCARALAYEYKMRLDQRQRRLTVEKLTEKEERRIKAIYEQLAHAPKPTPSATKKEDKYEKISVAWENLQGLRRKALEIYVDLHTAEVQRQNHERQWRVRQSEQAEELGARIKLGVIVNEVGKVVGAILDQHGNVDRSEKTKQKFCEACIRPTPNNTFLNMYGDAVKKGPVAKKQVGVVLGAVGEMMAAAAIAGQDNYKGMLEVLKNNRGALGEVNKVHKKNAQKNEEELDRLLLDKTKVEAKQNELKAVQSEINKEVKVMRVELKKDDEEVELRRVPRRKDK